MDSLDWACYQSDWYLRDYGTSTYLSCNGDGCYNIGTIYVDDSVSSLSVSINGCGKCSSKSSCIQWWTIKCNKGYSSFYDSTTFYGDSCSPYYCSCSLMSYAVSFVDNKYSSYCANSGGGGGGEYTDSATTGGVVGAVIGSL